MASKKKKKKKKKEKKKTKERNKQQKQKKQSALKFLLPDALLALSTIMSSLPTQGLFHSFVEGVSLFPSPARA